MCVDFKANWILILLFIITLTTQSCAPFKTLPTSIESKTEILGTYSNDCDSNNYVNNLKLWDLIDSKNSIQEDSLRVRFEITEKDQLIAHLVSDSLILARKLIRGKFKKDNCYYKRRTFYVVPILPVLWWYNNYQKRFYLRKGHLIYEETYNGGGVFIIIAGGDKGTYKRRFKKKT